MVKTKTLEDWWNGTPWWDHERAGKQTLMIKTKEFITFCKAIQYMIYRKYDGRIKYLDTILGDTRKIYHDNQEKRKK